jgi:hypothetical protein
MFLTFYPLFWDKFNESIIVATKPPEVALKFWFDILKQYRKATRNS